MVSYAQLGLHAVTLTTLAGIGWAPTAILEAQFEHRLLVKVCIWNIQVSFGLRFLITNEEVLVVAWFILMKVLLYRTLMTIFLLFLAQPSYLRAKEPRADVAVLRYRGACKQVRWLVIATSPTQPLTPVQLPVVTITVLPPAGLALPIALYVLGTLLLLALASPLLFYNP